MKTIQIKASNLRAAAAFASKKDDNVISGVLIEHCETGHAVVATDSYRLVSFASGDVSEDAARLIVDAASLKGLKASDAVVFIDAEEDGKTVRATIAGAKNSRRVEIWGLKDGDYPKYRRLLEDPKTPAAFTSLDASYVSDVCAVAKTAFGRKAPVSIVMGDDSEKCSHFYAFDDSCKMHAIIMPVRVDGSHDWAVGRFKGADREAMSLNKELRSARAEINCLKYEIEKMRERLEAKPEKIDAEKTAPEPKPEKIDEKKPETPEKIDDPKPETPEKIDADDYDALMGKAVEFAEAHGLDVKRNALNVWISGDTKPHKDELKKFGFKWAAKRGAWFKRAAA